jgi:hypothetical protein
MGCELPISLKKGMRQARTDGGFVGDEVSDQRTWRAMVDKDCRGCGRHVGKTCASEGEVFERGGWVSFHES